MKQQLFFFISFFIGVSATFIIALLIYYAIRINRKYRLKKFRRNIRPGDYCTVVLYGKKETVFVVAAWPDLDVVRVRHNGILHKFKYNEIYP